MASAKQIAWRKKFAKMAKSGKFKKSKKSKSAPVRKTKSLKFTVKRRDDGYGTPKYHPEYEVDARPHLLSEKVSPIYPAKGFDKKNPYGSLITYILDQHKGKPITKIIFTHPHKDGESEIWDIHQMEAKF